MMQFISGILLASFIAFAAHCYPEQQGYSQEAINGVNALAGGCEDTDWLCLIQLAEKPHPPKRKH